MRIVYYVLRLFVFITFCIFIAFSVYLNSSEVNIHYRMNSLIELRPDRDLLDANFNGYKLSLDSIPVYRHSLQEGVDHVYPSDDQYSFLHAKVFGLHNHLYGDPWSQDDVYYIDNMWKIKKSVRNASTDALDSVAEVWEIPSNHIRKPGHYNTSLSFSSKSLAVLADGAGTLHVVSTEQRTEGKTWKVLFSDEVCGKENSFVVLDSRAHSSSGRQELHILLLWIAEETCESKGGTPVFLSKLEWITLVQDENRDWSMHCVRQLSGEGAMDYAAIEPGCQSLYIASEKSFEFISDTDTPVQKKEEVETKPREKPPPEYMWLQTSEDITITFNIAEDVSKNSITVDVKANNIHIECKGKVLLEGPTWQRLDSDLSTWSLEKGRFQVNVIKSETGLMWQELVKGDTRGEHALDPGLVEEVHQRLAHLCSEKEVTDPNCPPSFNAQQLEECDAFPAGTSLLVRLEVSTHSESHRVNLSSHQWLFTVQAKPNEVPAICLRHDVDGCVWQFKPPKGEKDWPHKHIATFHAFGYVQASKQQRKFSSCAPDMSYVAISETRHRIYIYRQPAPVLSELRNRRTGEQVAHVAKQQVVSLDSSSEILGVHASNHSLYVLTADTLYALRINSGLGGET